jgi:hypothetical protein
MSALSHSFLCSRRAPPRATRTHRGRVSIAGRVPPPQPRFALPTPPPPPPSFPLCGHQPDPHPSPAFASKGASCRARALFSFPLALLRPRPRERYMLPSFSRLLALSVPSLPGALPVVPTSSPATHCRRLATTGPSRSVPPRRPARGHAGRSAAGPGRHAEAWQAFGRPHMAGRHACGLWPQAGFGLTLCSRCNRFLIDLISRK